MISDRPEVLASEVATGGQTGAKAHTAEVVEGYDNWKNQCVYKCATCPDFKAKLEAEFAVHLMMNHQVRQTFLCVFEKLKFFFFKTEVFQPN